MTRRPDDLRALARAAVSRNFGAQEPGLYGGDIPLLRTANVVGGTRLCVELRPEHKYHMFPLVTKRFHGSSTLLNLGRMVPGRSGVTAVIFRPGSVQVSGAQNFVTMRLAMHRVADVLRAHGLRPHMLFVRVDNCVATGGIASGISLERLVDCINGYSTLYDPEHFPGLICTPHDRATCPAMMLFESGKMMVLGVRSIAAANRAFLSFGAVALAHASAGTSGSHCYKSAERAARAASENRARELDATRQQRRRVSATKVARAVAEFVEENAGDRDTPDYNRRLRQHLDRVIAEAAAASQAATRRARPAPEPDDEDEDALPFEVY